MIYIPHLIVRLLIFFIHNLTNSCYWINFICRSCYNVPFEIQQNRIVTQATPPFLVIHTNAAFCRLTGIDSHLVVGKAISCLMTIQLNNSERLENMQQDQQDDENNSNMNRDSTNQSDIQSAPTRLRDRKEIGLERLIASSGFGQYHIVHVKTKQHHMVGRNVTIVKDGPLISNLSVSNQKSGYENASVTSSSDGKAGLIPCRSSIAPIVSSSSATIEYNNVLKTEKDYKRPKYHHYEQSDRKRQSSIGDNSNHRKYQPLQLVTHYVIQLQPPDETPGKIGSIESLSSNSASVEAQLLGLSKEAVQQQRIAVSLPYISNQAHEEIDDTLINHDTGGQGDEEMSTAESSATKLHVTAVG